MKFVENFIDNSQGLARFGVIVGDDDVYCAVGCGRPHRLDCPLLPLLSIVLGAQDRPGGAPIIVKAGASFARLVEESEEFSCRSCTQTKGDVIEIA